jgi:hypothetical protein
MHPSFLAPLQLTGRLWWRHWPQLMLLVLLGYLANHVLLEAAVRVGLANHVLGLCVLSAAVLAELLVVIAMFHTLKPSLPRLGTLATSSTASEPKQRPRALDGVSLVLAPFYAYYATWGFLGDSVRQYSLRGLELDPFGQHGQLLDAVHASGLLLVVGASWALRRFALRRAERTQRAPWQLLVTLCEASWLFIGLFVISKWKEQFLSWWNSRVVVQAGHDTAQTLFLHLPPPAHSALVSAWGTAHDIALGALLPLVWLAMAAMIFGRDVRRADQLTASNARLAHIADRYRGLPALPHYIGEHFIKGYRTRLLPVANCVRLTLGAGITLLLGLCIGYRALHWLSLWAWIGVTHLIGAHSLDAWQPIGNALGLLLVDPLQINASLAVEPLRICLLAAVLESALAATEKKVVASQAPLSVPAQA